MDTGALKKFAQAARRQLREQVAARVGHVLSTDSAELREKQNAIAELRVQIKLSSKTAVIDQVAYTWFNRFCALRYMDVNRYTRVGVVSPLEGFTQPEILQEAKQGLIDPDLPVNRQRVLDLLSGILPSSDPQQEAYRLLLVATCNAYYKIMPFMFEKIEDYTELLMPEDLLSENSILQNMREALTEENCQDVEVIGWLYQFYISERKDEVFENLKKNIKIEAEDIPAATQLFTPHWIVRYLVENSLGRLWMLNHPDSRLVEQMDYYIKPVQEETDYLKIESPEEIKICDPACGSGHMLTYAFDLLYAIYEESGYDPVQIPRLILEKNLYGIEIDPRAGALAAFALLMKVRSKDRRFFSRPVQPNICVLQNVTFTDQELKEYMSVVGRDLFSAPLLETLRQFKQADTFGSLIRPALADASYIRSVLETKSLAGDLFLHDIHQRVFKVLKQAEYLAPHYHVVVANPPYIGSKGMNPKIKDFAEKFYPDTKQDTFSMFIERIMGSVKRGGFMGLMTPFTWMHITTYQKLRSFITLHSTITTLIKPEYHAFFDSAFVPVCCFILFMVTLKEFDGIYIDLSDFYGADIQSKKALEAINNQDVNWCYRASVNDFQKIPGSPIVYAISDNLRMVFKKGTPLQNIAFPRKGLSTGKNDDFIRNWSEINKMDFSVFMGDKWFPMTKGGGFRKWYGNNNDVILWKNDGEAVKNYPGSVIRNEKFYLKPGGSWNYISMASFGIRYVPEGFINNAAGPIIYSDEIEFVLCLLNSTVARRIFEILSPTMTFEVGTVASFPVISKKQKLPIPLEKFIELTKLDWDSFELSWDFCQSPLLAKRIDKCLSETYLSLRANWRDILVEMLNLEEENNSIIIGSYGLQDELTPDVPVSEITLTCNPYYRYSSKKSEAELEALLLADTLKEFISYAVGCMFGRYSLEKPGLILANYDETADDYRRQIPDPTFQPDKDNVIPIMDEGWFVDDITERFKKFLRITFGEENYDENLAFLEEAIGKDVRSYFLKDFYNEHIKMYKKRPIYWLFSSPGGSFNALIYMHRYRPDTVSVVLSYLREYIQKLHAYKTHQEQVSITFGASQSEKTKALKEVNRVNKILAELKEYEDEVLYPLATQRIQIDLDDGVKVNYVKFGKALRKISGLSD